MTKTDGMARALGLTPEDKAELTTWSRSTRLDHRYVMRSRLILMRSRGSTYDEIQEALGISRRVVAKWIKRFSEQGMKGLRDAPRSGKPRKFSDEEVAKVLELVQGLPPKGYTNWSQRRLAEKTGMSQWKINRILKEHDLKPHRTEYWCGKSPDPEFETKMLDIVGLYLDPPDNALVLCVDEKTQMQALDRRQPVLPLTTGAPKRMTSTYKRHGTVSLMAALAVHDGEVTANTVERNDAENFLKFLKKLDRKYRKKKLHIILDNLSVHKHSSVKKWLKNKRKVRLHFTPTYSSWLNQVEIWFNILSKDVLKDGAWESKEQLVGQLMDYIKSYNENRAKPFEWTYNGRSTKSNLT